MLVGAMNHPGRPLEDELRRIAADGFDFVDLTFEPPGAWPVDAGRVAALLRELGLPAVGHTAYYLPIASPFPGLRAQAHLLFVAALDAFAAAGVTAVNVHPDPMVRLFPPQETVARNAEAIALLTAEATKRGITLLVENLGRSFSRADELAPIFDAAPEARFHLDVGHANLGLARGDENRTAGLLAAFRDRLAHVHVSDNIGGDDLHLPLGAGSIDWPAIVALLKQAGWDGTVTLEVFASEREHLLTSRRLWTTWWATEHTGAAVA